MNHRLSLGFGATALVAALVLLASCSGPGATVRGAPPDRPSPSSVAPIGVIAIGHSGLTGENSDPSQPGQPAPENSWATGSSPQVDSIYQRLVAQRPQDRGHVANTAVGGARVTTLGAQAREALSTVPAPALVIVQTIDNDIRCDGTDAGNVASFGQTLEQALRSINAASPSSKILVAGQLGRPRPAYIAQLVKADPGAKAALTGTGICDFFDANDQLAPKAFTTLTAIVDSYEAEETRVCSVVRNCQTDEGVRAAWTDKVEYFTHDWNHLNVAGLAEEARMTWPAVADLLRLS